MSASRVSHQQMLIIIFVVSHYFLAADIIIKKSLNREARRRHLIKITQENQAILRRLQAKQATYSVDRWEQEYHNNSMYRENVSQQPAYDFGDKFVGVVGASNVYG